MAQAVPHDDAALRDLSDAQREHLERKRYAQVGDEIVWIEPGGTLRRERSDRLYYIQTDRGVFRVSRITREVVEV